MKTVDKRNGLIYAADLNAGNSWIFSQRGLLRATIKDQHKVKRGWDGTVKMIDLSSSAKPASRRFTDEEALECIEPRHREARECFGSVDQTQQIPSWQPERYREARREYQSTYGRIPILPPDRYRSLYLKITTGCSHNQCTFCNFYRPGSHSVLSSEEFRNHLDDVRTFFGESIAYFDSVFLGEADAFSVRIGRLTSVLDRLRETPWIPSGRVYSFAQGHAGVFKDSHELRALARRNLDRIYTGLESGNSDLLSRIKKPFNVRQFKQSVHKLKQSGLSVGIVVLVGLGGNQWHNDHVSDTLQLLRSLPINSRDRIFLSPLKNSRVGWDSNESLQSLSDEEKEEQIELFHRGVPDSVPVIRYDIDSFLY